MDGNDNTFTNIGSGSLPANVVYTNASQTLTSKVLSGNTATNLISGSGTLTLNTSGTVTVPNATDTLIGKATTDTLTNKSISASTNTISNITNTEISSSAAISRSKIAAGTTSQVVYNDASSGLLVSEAALAKSRGGTGADNSSVIFPSSGTITTNDGTQTLTNKTLTTPIVDVLNCTDQSTPSNPSAGTHKIYSKTAGLYILNSSGTETAIGSPTPVPTVQKFLSTGTTTGYLFTITSASASVGATYTNNANTFTVLGTISSGTQLYTSSNGAPASSGTLTKATGTGAATITFASSIALATYTLPSGPAPSYIKIQMAGGGAGGAGSGTTGQTAGGDGVKSVFGANLLVANGGVGATTGQAYGGAGGTASLGTGPVGLALSGATGFGTTVFASSLGANVAGGAGGSTPYGGAGGASQPNNTGVSAAANTGSGGSGGGGNATVNSAGGAGGGAGGYIYALITSPSSSYPYCIGTGGAGGTGGGGSGNAGGNGAAGLILVEEYY